jgi:hypothetical protein
MTGKYNRTCRNILWSKEIIYIRGISKKMNWKANNEENNTKYINIYGASGHPFFGPRPQMDAHSDERQCLSGRCLSCMRRMPHFTSIRTIYDARPDGARFKDGRTSISLSAAPFSFIFLYSFSPKNRDILKSIRPILDPTLIT